MTLNKIEYETPVLTFANLCRMETWGLTVNDMSKRPLGFLSAFAALAIGGDLEAGEAAIEEHLRNGGTIDEISDELSKAVDESGFFKGASQEEEKASA